MKPDFIDQFSLEHHPPPPLRLTKNVPIHVWITRSWKILIEAHSSLPKDSLHQNIIKFTEPSESPLLSNPLKMQTTPGPSLRSSSLLLLLHSIDQFLESKGSKKWPTQVVSLKRVGGKNETKGKKKRRRGEVKWRRIEVSGGNSKFQTCVFSSRPFNLASRLPLLDRSYRLVFPRRGEEKGEEKGRVVDERKGGSEKWLLRAGLVGGVLCRLAKVSFKCFLVNNRSE